MSSILGTDVKLAFPNFTLVTASAGSGKTHTLTLRYLQLLLSSRIPQNHLKNILAITFTNNAAAEMKERILGYLKCAYLGIEKPGLDDLKTIVALDETTFRRRAGECLAAILDQYSDFQVQTIDSFITRLLKVSAVEFGLTPQFDVSFALTPLLNDSLDILARESVRNPQLRTLIDDIVRLMEDNRMSDSKYLWNPFSRLRFYLGTLAARLSTHRGEPVIENWETKRTMYREQIRRTIEAIDALVRGTEFSYTKTFAKIIEATRAGNIDEVVEKKVSQKPLLASKHPGYAQIVERIALLQRETEEAIAGYIEAKARAYYQPYVQVHLLLKGTMELLRRRNGEIQLAGGIRMMANRVNDEYVPEVYFTLGERIHHYLIDEFQDTSPIQWVTLRPLIENSLSQHGSLFLVGDTKQSIYSFRGADWQIMAHMEETEEFPSVLCDRKFLPINWRSSEAIVLFVNHVFHEIIPSTESGSDAEKSGLTSFHQEMNPGAAGTGFVEVTIFDPENDAPEGDADQLPEQGKLLSVIADCRERGFAWNDIAILTPKNDHVVAVSRWLNQAGIKFLSYSSLDIRSRTITAEILSLLRFLDSPIDDLAFSTFLLGGLYRSLLERNGHTDDMHEFVLRSRSEIDPDAPLYTVFRDLYPGLWNLHFENIFNRVGFLPVYDLIAEIYTTFEIFNRFPGEEATLIKLLEVIKGFEEQGANSLKEFIAYSGESEENDSWNMEKGGSVDSVTVMTVHKAKGLGFPVVITLFYDTTGRPDPLSIEEEGNDIRVVRTTKDWAEKSPPLAPIYYHDRMRRKVDDLNKLYVALTRAREEMFVLCVKSSRAHEPSSFLPQNGYTVGARTTGRQPRLPEEHPAPLLHPPTAGLIGASGTEILRKEEILRGELIHATLSGITFVDETSTDKLLSDLRAQAEKMKLTIPTEPISDVIIRFLNHEQAIPLFQRSENRTVITEMDVVGSDGRLRRIDRIIFDSDRITIVDYKTGAEREGYESQLRDYARVIRGIYPGKGVETLLAYVDLCVIRRVP